MSERKPIRGDRREQGRRPGWFYRWRFFWAGLLLSALIIQSVAWARDPIRSAAEIDYPPFCIVDVQGEPRGFSVELMRAALAAMGREVTFLTGSWADVRGWLEQGEVQALPLVGRTPEREAMYDFTFPYMSLHGAIVVRTDTTGIQDLKDLRGRRVAVMKGDNAEEFLLREDRGITIHTTTTFVEALRELSEGRHDAVVIQRLVALRLIREDELSNLRVVNKPIDGFRQDFCFAVKEGDRETLALLNEGLALITADGTYRHLHAKWFAALELPSHRRIAVGGDYNYPPYEYLDELGRPTGFTVELTRAIAREVGLDLEIRLGPWADVMKGLENGDIDVVQGMFYSPERDLKFDFSQPHVVNHYVSVVRKGEGTPPATLGELAGKRIVVERGDFAHDFLVANGLEGQLTLVESHDGVLRELVEGKHDCALVVRISALHLIEKHEWRNLDLGRTPVASTEYCYAVRNNQKALLAQFSEGLKMLEKTGEYRRIHDQWMGVHQPIPPDFATILRYVAVVAAPLLAILFGAFAWSWALRRQVAHRTRELRRSEEQFRSLVEGAPDAIYVQTEFRFSYVNSSACLLFGAQSPDELLGQSVMERFHPTVRDMVRQRITRLNEEQQAVATLEEIYLRLDGSEVPVEVSAVPVTYEGQHGALVFVRDISERKRDEDAIRRMAGRLNIILSAQPYGIVVVDENDRLEFVNEAFCKQFSLEQPPSTLIGCVAEELTRMILPAYSDLSGTLARLQEIVALGQPIQSEEVLLRDGRTFLVDFTPIEVAGVPSGRMWQHRDISRRKRAEEEKVRLEQQFHQAQKLESIGRLAGGVAHDFNNMLSVILGHSELALARVDPSEALHDNLGEILLAARRASDITRQLLAFARKQTVVPKVLDLNETVEGMLKMLRRLIGENIYLSWLPGRGLWTVLMDPSQIDQILANLCVNARDAIAEVGKVSIETEKVVFDEAFCANHAAFVPGDFIRLTVSDDGCGMDRETMDRLFEPFFTTKEVGQGTGLGLATVYGIVKQNDGFITVSSEPGKGTAFNVFLPRHVADSKAKAAESPAVSVAGGHETILLVEDDPATLNMGKLMLEGFGYRVLTASRPTEAILKANEHAGGIHLLITDVIMPEMNGRDLVEKLRSSCPNLGHLFISGYTADIIGHHGVLEEEVNFLQKPFSMQVLAHKVREVLDGSEEKKRWRGF